MLSWRSWVLTRKVVERYYKGNHQGHGGISLHEAYQNERRHVVLVIPQQSVKYGQQNIGTLEDARDDRQQSSNSKPESLPPQTGLATRSEVMKGAANQREHFDNLSLHIGYVYGDTEIAASASRNTASYRTGAGLSHAWLSKPPSSQLTSLPAISNSCVSELSATALAEKQYSTLDLLAFDSFTLIFSTTLSAYWSALDSEP
ncbi:hypothetical protein BKA65DRAFT_104777 [Rhexocercosporidium sp. MPI-PUGE-AT-0058]|nr:hypothetical protein BKA65DRAFT_104777 [Rhexocercosporidium sp. MPI-PUGE-AT-0058]